MHFELYLRNKKNDENEIIRFLNSSARSFYSGSNTYGDKSFDIVLKSAFFSGITDLERTIRGTFDCDLNFANVDIVMLNKMFPCATAMFNVSNFYELSRLSRFLTLFRNINAHALISKWDNEFFEIDYSFLQNQVVFDDRIKYYEDEITLAGSIFILLNFLREESIANLCKKNFLFGLISKGRLAMDDGYQFVTQISHVNLEMRIRQDNANTVFDAMLGNYRKNADISEKNFDVKIGLLNYPTYKVSGSLIGNLLKINSGSLTKTYYKKDFLLQIIDEKSFIELSNQLPPFVLVDFLYQMDISVLDGAAVGVIKEKYKFISKLNRPKFYVDKNLSVLLMPSNISDFRIISSLCRDAIGTILLSVENFIYKTRKIKRDSGYSSIDTALSYLDICDSVHKRVKYLRNFVAHGYVLDEYMLYKSEKQQFTIEFIIKVFKTLLDACGSIQDIYSNILWNVKNYLINTLVGTKYKKIIEFSRSAMLEYPNINMYEFSKKSGFVNNSMFDICDFNSLTESGIKYNQVIRISMPNLTEKLYLNNVDADIELLNTFCTRNGYNINSIQDNGLMIEYELV